MALSMRQCRLPAARSAFSSRRVCRSRQSLQVKAALDATQTLSVTQQAAAFAMVLAAEGAYTRSFLPTSDKGQPQIPIVAGGIAGTVAAAALVSNSGSSTVGLFLGMAASTAMFAYCVKRVTDTEYDDAEWPGPKAWPAGMALISFFALNVFFQGVRADFMF